jgi:hypothetical protein
MNHILTNDEGLVSLAPWKHSPQRTYEDNLAQKPIQTLFDYLDS